MSIFERLNFAGIRLIAVSQGIDSDNEQAQVLVTVHGMVDSLYVKELAKKTHRGLEGLVLRGQHATGTIRSRSMAQQESNWSSTRAKRKSFAAFSRCRPTLVPSRPLPINFEPQNAFPSPRPRSGKKYATWCPTCIREMLRRDLYVGKVIWNSSRFVKVPGTNKRVRRAHPELQIVNDELWLRVQERQKCLMTIYSGAKKGLLPRLVTSPYLLSGILKCGVCGGNLIIITGYSSYGHYPQYGCSQHFKPRSLLQLHADPARLDRGTAVGTSCRMKS